MIFEESKLKIKKIKSKNRNIIKEVVK